MTYSYNDKKFDNRRIFLVIIVFIILSIFSLSCYSCIVFKSSDSLFNTINTYATESVSPSSKYFGYFYVSPDNLNDIGVLHNANIVQIDASSHFPQDAVKLRSNNLCATLTMHWIFSTDFQVPIYDESGTQVAGGAGFGNGVIRLRSNWKTIWNEFNGWIKGNEDVICSFYFDEPFWNGWSFNDFRMITKLIRDTYPNKKILVYEAPPVLDISYWNETIYNHGQKFHFADGTPVKYQQVTSDYYEYVTDLGVDYYERNMRNFSEVRLNDMVNTVKRLANRGQNIWLEADQYDATYTANPNLGKETYNTLHDRMEMYRKIVKNDKRVVGIILYLYRSNPPAETGLVDLYKSISGLQDYHVQIGQEITGLKKTDVRGALKVQSQTSIVGWACDAANTNVKSSINIYDGPYEEGKVLIQSITEASAKFPTTLKEYCNDDYHGFKFIAPNSIRDGKDHYLYAYGSYSDKSGFALLPWGGNIKYNSDIQPKTTLTIAPTITISKVPTSTQKPGTPIPTKSPTPLPTKITISTTPKSCPLQSQGDVNCDGKIDLIDFEIWRESFFR
ncbi:hypothetical protein HGA88_00680 [Candidatus Roizmanbacteria bacterium]|nr:hypothetical protein [Candidatus Roizmanbacteria bacterium]